ncbi:S53 family peptidase [Paraconexibacter antarcticus]|uniref:S53 family peptidase n=1 Tax=Paraconexibacter antarcticus TaxID=2949664 RepID=A0ABY5DS71_9ACTN|nr:S53 family peptidase [Paraconexibacter antarcticus]UTI63662.1 S53 family peptidase [Paraconexibacter antarcticus]
MHVRHAAIALAAVATFGCATPGAVARTRHAARTHRLSPPHASVSPLALEAPSTRGTVAGAADATTGCTSPPPVRVTPYIHCYTPADIASHYGVSALHDAGTMGQGQTIVLVDAYGSPTAKADLQTFHDTFYPGLPDPDFTADYPFGAPDYKTSTSQGVSGPSAAAGWAGEVTLDLEWAYAMAPRAHIVMLAVPPAETLGVQGFPNLFKAMSAAIDRYPAGTVFSQSFGVSEETFGGAAATQTAKFDAVYRKAAAKGDTVLASSGDDGTLGTSKQHKESTTYGHPTVGWPASSPYVTAVGGTQLQKGWTWNPTSDIPFTAAGDYNPSYWAFTPGGEQDVVWNESWLPAATGGGQSSIYARPGYQDSVADVVGAQRGIPDLAWDAAVNGGVLVYTSFYPDTNRVGWHIYGGTSSSSPQVAGLVALGNQRQAAKPGGKPLGFLNPLIYSVGSGPAFTDVVPVTEGTALSGRLDDNQDWDYNGDGVAVTKDPVTGNPTTGGYDMTTGFGVPNAAAFVSALGAARDATP